MPQYHIVASSILATIFYYFTSSFFASFICFSSGFFIDIDHLLDFWLYRGRIILDKEIFQNFYEKWDKVPVLLHSIEFLIPLWLLGYALNSFLLVVAASTGFVFHLALDFFSNKIELLGYFLSYRLAKGFDKRSVCGSR